MRIILHSDLNNFYASVELLRHPELRGVPVAVCGSREDRHGIVLARNQPAKEAGVKTGDVIWQAEKKCPGIVLLPADFLSYLRVSKTVREIYERYTDRVEAFGIDECWLDVTDVSKLFGGGRRIAEEIRAAVKAEIGITVSWNKIFAKLASDMKKPDAVTELTPENYRKDAWSLPVGDLLYVGPATEKNSHCTGSIRSARSPAPMRNCSAHGWGSGGAICMPSPTGLTIRPCAGAKRSATSGA